MSKNSLKKIYFKALEKVLAKNIIKDNISIKKDSLFIVDKKYRFDEFRNLYIYGVGKAAVSMALECENILGDKIKGGVIVSNQSAQFNHLEHFSSTHPNVSQKSLDSADALISSLEKLNSSDLFIFLLSGGASAMIEKPIDNLSLENFKKITSALLTSGIDIKSLNSVRKSISQIKGGKLANFTKAKGVVLVLSDVVGDDIDTIGSAPMNNNKFEHKIVGNNEIALQNAKKYISKKVDFCEIISTTLELSSKKSSKFIYEKVIEYDKKYDSFALLFGGESVAKVKGNGQGGRNQELALRILLEGKLPKECSILCAGSDGVDGNSIATGAFLDKDIYKKIKLKQLNPRKYLKNSDSYSFFKALDYDFTIGKTGTNVMDFIIVLKDKNNG